MAEQRFDAVCPKFLKEIVKASKHERQITKCAVLTKLNILKSSASITGEDKEIVKELAELLELSDIYKSLER